MKTYVLNVGYGESLVIQNGDRCLVLDGGPIVKENDFGEVKLVDFLKKIGIKAVDMMICTHMHYDHTAGLLEVCKQFEVSEFICNMLSFADVTNALKVVEPYDDTSMVLFHKSMFYYSSILNVLRKKGTKISQKCFGDTAEIYGIKITFYGLNREESKQNVINFEKACLSNDIDTLRFYDKNLNSTSLAMHFSKINLFWTGDLVDGYERFDLPKSDVLKLTHHGQKDGMAQILLDKIEPSAFLICANKDKMFNSACDEILERCKEYLNGKSLSENIYITGLLKDFANAVLIENGKLTPFYLDK